MCEFLLFSKITSLRAEGRGETGKDSMRAHIPVLLFVKGAGHRSAIIAEAVATGLRGFGLVAKFVSYGAGAETLAGLGREPQLLLQNDSTQFSDVLVAAARLIAKEAPPLVISYGEPAVTIAAATIGVPVIYLIPEPLSAGVHDWEALTYCNAALVMEQPGVQPMFFRGNSNLHFVGRAVRAVRYSAQDRLSLRLGSNIDINSVVMCVVPGASTLEETAPWADVIITAFRQIAFPQKALLWFTNRDRGYLKEKTRGFPEIFIQAFSTDIDKVMAISDVVIAKGAGTILDALSVGTRAVSLSPPGSELSLSRLQGHLSLNLRAMTGELLHRYISSVLKQQQPNRIKPNIQTIVDVVAREAKSIIGQSSEVNTRTVASV